MRRNRMWSWAIVLTASVVAIAAFCAQSQQIATAQDQNEPEGRIVQIGEPKDEPAAESTEGEASAAPLYWIGLRGRGIDDPVLRTQLQLAEDTGVVIEEVVAESPAEKAGLRKHDIILRSNGDMVDSMEVLQQQVQATLNKPIELTILRLGKEMDVTVTPDKRPDDFEQLMGPAPNAAGRDLLGGDLGRLLQQLQEGALPEGMRVIGPGVVLNGRPFNFNAIPEGMSVSITRTDDGPAQITVKKGDQTWQFNSDDAKALAQLPEEVRNYVSGMLNGQKGLQGQFGNLDLNAELRHWLPERLGNMPGFDNAFQAQEDEVSRRLNEMQEQLEQLQQKLRQQDEAAP